MFNGDAYRSDTPFRNAEVQKEPEGDIEIDIATFKLPGGANLAYADASKDNTVATRLARNRFQSALMDASDRKCEVHRAAVMSTASSVNLGLGWLSAAFAGASPLIVPTLTKNVFAAAAGLATTSRSLVNEEVYKQLLVTSILQAIESERDGVAADIERKRALLPNDYSVDDALRDAQIFHSKCSFYIGLVALSEAVEEKANCEEDRLRREELIAELSKPDVLEPRKASYTAELATLQTRVTACK
ncbi:MAG TPA: hypothetical protein VGQ36_21615 [Thermoanaerobaculia bacterium]|nr:hypothetical protein [Thermoanaerobaculia bacterium]